MIEELNVICVGDIRHRYKGEDIHQFFNDYDMDIFRVIFKDGSSVTYNRKNIICVEHVKSIKATKERDGCINCKYESRAITEYPCNKCKGSYTDMWESI